MCSYRGNGEILRREDFDARKDAAEQARLQVRIARFACVLLPASQEWKLFERQKETRENEQKTRKKDLW